MYRKLRNTRLLPVVLVALGPGCGGTWRPPAIPVLPFAADSVRAAVVAPGIVERYLYAASGPWAIYILDVSLGLCYSARAVKGAGGAVGREKTSALLAQLQHGAPVIGGVNADFFLFAPPGVPAGALISDGRVIAGPSNQPVLAFDSAGRPRVARLRSAGNATLGNRQYPLSSWNRATPDGLALFDSNWGRALDTASGVIEVALSGRPEGAVLSVDTVLAGSSVPPNGLVLVAGRSAPVEWRNALIGLRSGERALVNVGLEPWHPLEAVGGRPVLIEDSSIVSEVDTEGQPGFAAGRHPRTAAGIADHGTRLLLVVVDGRQRPFSDGMTLRELARLMLGLGSHDAINLDGGGSSTLVWATPGRPDVLRIANRPSDPAGERPVGDALAVVRGCHGPPRS